MPDDTPKPPDVDPRSFWRKVGDALSGAVVQRAAVALAAAAVGALMTHFGCEPRTVERVTEIIREVPVRQEAPDEFTPTMGWVKDEEAIAANLDRDKTLHFAQTPAGKAALGDEDVFLWRDVRKVAGREAPWYPNINQGSVGSCVGAGFKHGCDVVQATAILSGEHFEWKPVSAEAIYAGSRVEVGGGRLSGDGSLGSWAAKWVRERGGLVPMEKIGAHDLTSYSAARAREWGRRGRGVPDDLESLAKNHPVRGAALVTSAEEAKRAIQQHYPIPVCSGRGFRMERDAQGFCRPQGSWSHCMLLAGYRGGNRPGFYVLNSWGDRAHTGPVWPPDMPVAGFWADWDVVDRMLRQGDSFALSDVQGFPQRKLDWNIRAVPSGREQLASDIRKFRELEYHLAP